MESAFIEIRNLVKRFNSTVAVGGISFDVEQGRLVTLLGPSGCGKTTTLRCLAGLESPEEGEIVVGGELLSSSITGQFVSPEDRGVGMVFQSYAIWPHMTVFDNVAFPLRVRRLSRSERQQRVTEALEIVGLAGMAERGATQLSGGQQQRVALARALVYRPKVLLFDEPLSNLDAKLRERMRFELVRLQNELGITSVYVTHDQTEAMAISDRVVVMNQGRIEQIGDPREIYQKPGTPFVADFIGTANFLPGTVASTELEDGLGEILVHGSGDEIRVRCRLAQDEGEGEDVWVVIRAERLRLGKDAPAISHNVWEAEVTHTLYGGDHLDCQLRVSGLELRCKTDIIIDIRSGDRMYAWAKPSDCIVLKRGHDDGSWVPPNAGA